MPQFSSNSSSLSYNRVHVLSSAISSYVYFWWATSCSGECLHCLGVSRASLANSLHEVSTPLWHLDFHFSNLWLLGAALSGYEVFFFNPPLKVFCILIYFSHKISETQRICVSQCMYGGQRTNGRNRFSPSNMWSLGL